MVLLTKRLMASVLVLSVLIACAFPTAAGAEGATTPVDDLAYLEYMLFGQKQGGAILPRIQKLEMELYGEAQTGALFDRISKMRNYVESSEVLGASLLLQVNAVEWMIYHKITQDRPLVQRLESLEASLYGDKQKGGVVERIANLVGLIWPGKKLNIKRVQVPEELVVKIEILNELDSATSKVGDPVDYRVVENVKIDDYIVIPEGVCGQGKVDSVEKEGRFGKQGRVVVDFGSVNGIDGTPIKLEIGEKATKENRSLQLAAGASIAGVILLGPIGLISGYLVEGEKMKVPEGTKFFTEVAGEVAVIGLSMMPVE